MEVPVSAAEVPATQHDHAQAVQGLSADVPHPHLTRKGQALSKCTRGLFVGALVQGGVAEIVERVGDTRRIPERALDGETFA